MKYATLKLASMDNNNINIVQVNSNASNSSLTVINNGRDTDDNNNNGSNLYSA